MLQAPSALPTTLLLALLGQAHAADPACTHRVDEAVASLEAHKPLSASMQLHEHLQAGGCPEEQSRAEYHMGSALYTLDLYTGALPFFRRVVDQGPGDPFFQQALRRVVSIAALFDDRTPRTGLPGPMPQQLPPPVRAHLSYLAGVALFEQGELAGAHEQLRAVEPGSVLALRALYLDGVIQHRAGRLKSAVKAFRQVIRDSEELPIYSEAELDDVDLLYDLSVLNVARIYYGIGRFDDAQRYDDLVSPESREWSRAQLEGAWAAFMRGEPAATLHRLDAVNSGLTPERRRKRLQEKGREREIRWEDWLPEAQQLRGITLFSLCRYEEAEGLASRQLSELEAQRTRIRGVLSSPDPEGRLHHLDPALARQVRESSELRGIARWREGMAFEAELIGVQKSLWRASVGAELSEILAQREAELDARARELVVQELEAALADLQELAEQAELLRQDSARAEAWSAGVGECRRLTGCVRWAELDQADEAWTCVEEGPYESCCPQP